MKIGAIGSVLCSALLLAAPAALAVPVVEWASAVPAPAQQHTFGMVAVADGYVAAGLHLVQPGNPISGGAEECVLTKVGLDGTPLWQRFHHAGSMSWCEGVASAGDGFLLAGGTWPNYYYSGGRIVLIRTDAAGNQLWRKNYDANDDAAGIDGTWGHDVVAAGDGGFVILASRSPVNLPDSPVMLLKVDADGNELWRTFPGDGEGEGLRIGRAADGGFIVSGWKLDVGAETAWLLRTDASGNRLWSATYPIGPNSSGMGVEQTPDGGFAVAGYAGLYGAGDLLDPFVLKVDAAGVRQWASVFGGPGDGLGYDVAVAADGALWFTGSERTPWSEELNQSEKAFVRKLAASGELLGERFVEGAPGESWSHGNVIEPAADGGFIVGGEMTTGTESPTTYDAWFVKLAPEQTLPAVTVTIDVKPGSAENPINLKAQGTVPVAILTTPAFDAATVDRRSARFAGAAAALKPNGKVQAALEDVDGDGDLDLLLHFPIPGLRLAVGDTVATLTGVTAAGAAISGADAVTVKAVAVGRRKKKQGRATGGCSLTGSAPLNIMRRAGP